MSYFNCPAGKHLGHVSARKVSNTTGFVCESVFLIVEKDPFGICNDRKLRPLSVKTVHFRLLEQNATLCGRWAAYMFVPNSYTAEALLRE